MPQTFRLFSISRHSESTTTIVLLNSSLSSRALNMIQLELEDDLRHLDRIIIITNRDAFNVEESTVTEQPKNRCNITVYFVSRESRYWVL